MQIDINTMLLIAILTLTVVAVFQLRTLNGRLKQSRDDDVNVAAALRSGREEAAEAARRLREEVARGHKDGVAATVAAVQALGKTQKQSLDGVEARVKETRETVDSGLKRMQDSNEKKLEQMRATVDEKLQSTLEKRLGESFKLVSERLEAVQKGLGEMQTLATGVGDLKRVLSNVKTRGTWGEYRLGDILEQILAPGQYQKNVQPRPGSQATVEYAVKLPGRDADAEVWLPIDAKFPQEDYQRLLEAAENADAKSVEDSTAALMRAIIGAAKDIREKYIEPPHTTDFAIMFLPTEGLYAEVLRQPGMMEKLQQQHRVVVAGPTTFSAILNSLHMGFRTLAIEKRSSEVWKVLAAVKTEFGRFGDVLDKVKRQLGAAAGTIDNTQVRTRAMARQLRDVEALPQEESGNVLGLDAPAQLPTDDKS